MTFRKFLLIPIIGLIVLASAALPDYLNDTNPEREGLILRKVIEGLGELHYEPQKVNDEFSKRVYELYMNKLDNGKRFLTQSDIKKLGKYELELDNQAKVGSFE
jgi:carboxyl-terminal processing protease